MKLKEVIFILSMAFSMAATAREKVLVSYTFDSDADLADWMMEGDGKAYVENGKLILEPEFFPLMDSLMREGKVSLRNDQSEYFQYLYPAMKAKHGEKEIENYFYMEDGKKTFRGGHFNFWNTEYETPENFAIEFDFRSLSPAPLHMLMFCASGLNGESVLDPSLPKRYGKAVEIMYELAMYRVSYFFNDRGTANLRRAPGRIMAVKGPDLVSENPEQVSHCRVERIDGVVKYFVNGTEVFSYADDNPLKGKDWGFRLMVCAKGEYDNITVKEIIKTPQGRPLSELQQEILDLRFGMFIHYNIPTYSDQDWPDPDTPVEVFNPKKLDCNQWADVAVSANMQYACLTTKHHSGFCIWDTKTTDYNVMNSPLKRDVVREYVDAFRKKGLRIMLYFSILDTHHDIRPGWINRQQVEFIKAQLTELLTNYGKIDALVIDGWDAWWSRISYEDIPFAEIYWHIKSLQPDCLISEHNAGKYPDSELFYTDYKQYEQNAGQYISRETNRLPAQAGLPINKNWFWKESFPKAPVKSAEFIVYENLIPLNEAHCNFILNVAPNRDGLVDANVVREFKKIGKLWKYPGKAPELGPQNPPVIYENLAKHKPMSSSWSFDTRISDLASDDDFTTYWVAYEKIKEPFLEVDLQKDLEINAVGFVESDSTEFYNRVASSRIGEYEIQYYDGQEWKGLEIEPYYDNFVRMHRFPAVRASKIRYIFRNYVPGLAIKEVLVYNEER